MSSWLVDENSLMMTTGWIKSASLRMSENEFYKNQNFQCFKHN